MNSNLILNQNLNNNDINIVEFHFIINNSHLNIFEELNNLFLSNDTYFSILDTIDNMGAVEIGVEDKTKVLKKIEDIDNIHLNVDKCSICYSLFENKDNILKTVCNHYFCNYCINNWLNKSKKCPCCMYDFDLIK